MSIFKKNTTKKEIETSLNEIQINLENNYKDLAIKAFKDSSELVERIIMSLWLMRKRMVNIKDSLMYLQREWKVQSQTECEILKSIEKNNNILSRYRYVCYIKYVDTTITWFMNGGVLWKKYF